LVERVELVQEELSVYGEDELAAVVVGDHVGGVEPLQPPELTFDRCLGHRLVEGVLTGLDAVLQVEQVDATRPLEGGCGNAAHVHFQLGCHTTVILAVVRPDFHHFPRLVFGFLRADDVGTVLAGDADALVSETDGCLNLHLVPDMVPEDV